MPTHRATHNKLPFLGYFSAFSLYSPSQFYFFPNFFCRPFYPASALRFWADTKHRFWAHQSTLHAFGFSASPPFFFHTIAPLFSMICFRIFKQPWLSMFAHKMVTFSVEPSRLRT